jgi:alcohol dehydrogenase class IV
MRGIEPFASHLPVRVRFGSGRVSELGSVLQELGATRPLALVDPGVRDADSLAGRLPAAGQVRYIARGEPTVASIEEMGAEVRELRPDVLIAVGGGSTLDTAKGARVVAETGDSIRAYAWPLKERPVPPLRTPLIAIPTTAGTGSEVTGGAVFADPEQGIKLAAVGPNNRAYACIVDPELTLTLPPEPTRYGGLDVLAQAIGSVVSATHTPVGDAFGLEALNLVSRALPAVVADGSDLAARSHMACASLLAGLAMNASEAGTDHSLGHALGAVLEIPHGLSVGVMLPEAMEHERRYVPERFERVADALGAPPGDARDGSRAVTAVRELLALLKCPTLAELGVGEASVDALVDSALRGWIPVEPGPWGREAVRAAFLRALRVSAKEVSV